MNGPDNSVRTTLRIAGSWSHPQEMIEQMPKGFRFDHKAMFMPDGTEITMNLMPPESFITGSGNARMNIVSTGATNDIGHATICENSMQSAVPSAMRRMRTLAILMRSDPAAAACPSEGISENACDPYVDFADEIECPVLTGVDDHGRLRANPNRTSLFCVP